MQRVYAIFGKSRRVLYGLLFYAAVGSAVILVSVERLNSKMVNGVCLSRPSFQWAISTQKYNMSPTDEVLHSVTGLRCPVTVSGMKYVDYPCVSDRAR